MMIAVAAVTLSLALWQPPAIFWISIFAATLFAASWGPTAFASVLWKRVTKTGAFWSITVGSIGVAVTELLNSMGMLDLPVYLNSAVFGGILSIIALIVGSLLTEPTKEELAYRENLLILPEEEKDAKKIRQTKKYPVILYATGVVLIVITFVYYYIPIYM